MLTSVMIMRALAFLVMLVASAAHAQSTPVVTPLLGSDTDSGNRFGIHA